jgi:hypothetical protein
MRRNSVVVLLALSLLLISCDPLGGSAYKWQKKAQEQNWAPGSGASLDQQLYWLGEYAKSNTEYVIEVKADETISYHNFSSSFYANREMTNITIRLKGGTTARTLSRNENVLSMFHVGRGYTLILDSNITLKGRSGNSSALVEVWGGALQMNEGASICGNSGVGVSVHTGSFSMNGGTISGNSGVGVSVYGGSFSMSGGTISGNSGGVSVYGGGSFTMSGGTISGNSSSNSGGGVVVHGGSFSMSGGIISGNSFFSGGGVYMYGGSFNMSGGTISGNSASGGGGGGVYVGSSSTFTKTGGTIYGYTAGDSNSNVVKDSSGVVLIHYITGHAVYVESSPVKRRETTAGPGDNLDSRRSGSAGGWE